MKTYNPATARLVYLNQDGSRCVSIDANGNRERIPVSIDGGKTIKQVAVKYFQQLGNHSAPWIRFKGKIEMVVSNQVIGVKYWQPYRITQGR